MPMADRSLYALNILMHMSPHEITNEEIQRLYQVKTYLLNHLHQRHTVKQLARGAAMNESKFREAFYMVFSYVVQDYIIEARMQLGFFLLKHTNKAIKEIAWLAGYRQSKNFMNAFKKYFGITAMTVRK